MSSSIAFQPKTCRRTSKAGEGPYPDAMVIIEASWNWPHSMGQVQVFGPKGTGNKLFYRPIEDRGKTGLEGEPIALRALQGATSNPVAYSVDCIRHDKPIEDPLSTRLNVQVMEILDAARESVRTGQKQELR
jgi:predicted dehydrogenase